MDERNRRAELERLTAWARVGFAALCCERLLPAYAGFARATRWGDPRVLRQALDGVWAAIASGQAISDGEARELVERCEQQVPHLDDPFDTDLAAPAQNPRSRCWRLWNAPATGIRRWPNASPTCPLMPSRPMWI
jgi:uncharacterized protein YjaG (DUF416 family)